MSSEILLTQEIGSLSRHRIFKENLGDKEKEEIIQEALDLGVEDIEELRLLLNSKEKDINKIEGFASLFAIRLFEKVGLDIIFNGEQPRKEMYHYPMQFIKGVRFLGESRVFDNQYFPRGEIYEPPELIEPYHLKEFLFVKSKTKKKIKVPITGAYTLADWSYNLYYQRKWINKLGDYFKEKFEAKRELTLTLARNVIRENIRALVENGAEIIQIDEPAATTVPNEIPIFVEALNESTRGINCKFSVHVCFSRDYRMLFPHILEAKNISQLALEFANRDGREAGVDETTRKGYSFLKFFKENAEDLEIGLGVIDVHTDFIEPVELIKDRIRYALKIIDKDRIYVNPDCGLRTRTWSVARAKLENMVRAVKELRKEIV